MSMSSIIRRELTDDVVFKPLTLALLVTGIFAAGMLIGGATVFLMIAAALA